MCTAAMICGLGQPRIGGIIQNHPFDDGNKRAELLPGLLVLGCSGKTTGKLCVAERDCEACCEQNKWAAVCPFSSKNFKFTQGGFE
jgi:hypothetical protein